MKVTEIFEKLKEASHDAKDHDEAYSKILDVFHSIEFSEEQEKE